MGWLSENTEPSTQTSRFILNGFSADSVTRKWSSRRRVYQATWSWPTALTWPPTSSATCRRRTGRVRARRLATGSEKAHCEQAQAFHRHLLTSKHHIKLQASGTVREWFFAWSACNCRAWARWRSSSLWRGTTIVCAKRRWRDHLCSEGWQQRSKQRLCVEPVPVPVRPLRGQLHRQEEHQEPCGVCTQPLLPGLRGQVAAGITWKTWRSLLNFSRGNVDHLIIQKDTSITWNFQLWRSRGADAEVDLRDLWQWDETCPQQHLHSSQVFCSIKTTSYYGFVGAYQHHLCQS